MKSTNKFKSLFIISSFFAYFSLYNYSQTCTINTYNNWLSEQCGNFAYNGNFAIPVSGAPIPASGGGNIAQSCMWTTLGTQTGYSGNPHAGTVDLYMPNNINFQNATPFHLGVPTNTPGVINDHTTGASNQSGYMGLYTYYDGNNYREYMVNEYSFHFTAGETYTISFWASLAPWSSYATHLDAWVGRQVNMPTIPGGSYSNNLTFFSVPAAVTKLYTTGIINNIGSWNQYSFTFTPGITGEYFLVLGNFKNSASTPHPNSPGGNLGPYTSAKIPGSYYYIDDITVTGKSENFCCYADYQFIDNDVSNTEPNTDIYWSSFPTPTPGALGASMPWGSTVYVNGILHIDQSVNLYFVDMKFSPGSSLVIEPGVTFTTKYSTLHGCPRMWTGISSSSPTALIDMLNTTVTDATQAINCTNGVPLVLRNNTFRNNLNNIKLSNFSGPTWPLTFTGNEIRCTSFLLAPLTFLHSNFGVEVNNVSHVNLSQAGINNKFYDLQSAIVLNNSNANVSNILITSTGVPTNSPFTLGIYCNSTDGFEHFVRIANGSGLTHISKMFNGIHFYGKYYNQVISCLLNDITNVAISFDNNPYSNSFNDYQIKCRNNIIRNAKIGISVRETYNTRLHIRNNNIGNTGYIKNSIGIDFVNTYQTQTTCDKPGFINRQFILSNKITRFQTGINTEQANCMVVDSNLIRMNNNFGFFTQFHGIWSKNCTNGEIGLNEVNGGNLSTSSCIGIRLLSNNTERVFCNTIDSNDYAIWMEGAGSFTTRMEKNTLSKYNNGFYFTGNLSLNHQLIVSGTSTPLVQSNAWVDKAITGLPTKEFNTAPGLNMTGTNFYFLFADPDPNTSFNDIHTIGISPNVQLISSSHILNCNGTVAQGRMVIDVLKDSTNMHWDSLSVFGLQTKWLTDRATALASFVYADTLALDTLPVTVQSHIDTINNFTTCPSTILVDKYINDNDFVNAAIINSNIDNSCSMGAIYQEFNTIVMPYLEAYRNFDTIVVDSADQANVIAIANLCLYQYGQVVSSARSFVKNFISDTLIFENPCEVPEIIEPRTMNSITDNKEKFKVYPVPASDFINLTSTISDELSYQLYDMQGRVLLNGKFSNSMYLSLENLPSGNYVIRLYNANEEHREKIIISR